jgi:dATP pyrophosphohydrolase
MYKIPRSVLVVIHTPDLGDWQSVTGSLDREDEPLHEAAAREVAEETGIDAGRHALADWGVENTFEIFRQWRSRYAPGVTHNVEHVFGLTVPMPLPVRLAPEEHSRYVWLPWREAADKCFSWSNRDAILMLPDRVRAAAA